MKKNILLLMIFIIFLFSSFSFFIILNYLDPYSNKVLAVLLITFSFIFMLTSFFTLFLYFIKKIYYRGEVDLFNIKTSFRQAYFIAIFIFWIIVFEALKAPVILLSFLLFIILLFWELFLQNLED